ncbi:hypothetical protein JB92DRAFT_3146519 [Gautieria morchelliformis]|nr:hypothetical protein JB92DRAFT_3146519 [Gautieria morchelliformis]
MPGGQGKKEVLDNVFMGIWETTRSLAYVAVLTYFAMSSSENNQKSGAAFELSAMYWQIVKMLEDDDLKEEADALLLWWNQQIFLSKSAARSSEQDVLDPILKLKAQKAAKKARESTGGRGRVLYESTNH